MTFIVKKTNGWYGIYNKYDNELINWQDLYLDKAAIKKYIEKKSFPEDRKYNLNDFFIDFRSEGTIVIPSNKIETAEYIRDMIEELV